MAGHRLGEVTPYPLPSRGALRWFLCRWPLDAPLRTALPAGATARERELLELALERWEQALPGLRFERLPAASRAELRITIVAKPDAERAARQAGWTASECAVVDREDGFAARLVQAEVKLHRSGRDVLGREVPLGEDEWLGTVLHELGHALGFQGHVRQGAGIMLRNVEEIRRHGRHVLTGAALRAPSVVALYRVPSGERLAERAVGAERTRVVDRLAVLAAAKGYRGPLVRVGDRAARIAWWDGQGRSVGVHIPGVGELLGHPERLRIEPDLLAEAWLGPSPSR